jgi:hypothetical protein
MKAFSDIGLFFILMKKPPLVLKKKMRIILIPGFTHKIRTGMLFQFWFFQKEKKIDFKLSFKSDPLVCSSFFNFYTTMRAYQVRLQLNQRKKCSIITHLSHLILKKYALLNFQEP